MVVESTLTLSVEVVVVVVVFVVGETVDVGCSDMVIVVVSVVEPVFQRKKVQIVIQDIFYTLEIKFSH